MRLQVASEFFIDFDKRNKELLAAFFFPKVRMYVGICVEVLELPSVLTYFYIHLVRENMAYEDPDNIYHTGVIKIGTGMYLEYWSTTTVSPL